MKSRVMMVVGLAVFAGASVTVAAAQQPGVSGTWRGTLQGVGLTVVFHITAANDGSLTATMDSPDQGATGIPVSSVSFEDGVLRLASTAVGGDYEGRLGEDGQITGEWRQGGGRVPLVLERGAPPARRARPQEPTPPLPYDAEDVTFTNAEAGITLAGTFTRPRTPGPHPAVALISGSGAQDRDESLLGHKPFLVLADHLTRQGIAVLRYDDRGVAKSGGTFATATSADFVTDALAAVAWLRARSDVNAAAIGLIGHSEGGLIAPLAAVRSSDVKFIVMLAGPGVPGEEILYEQGRLIATASGAPQSAVEKNIATQRRIFQIIKETPDTAAARERVRTALHASLDSLSQAERAAMGFAGDLGPIVDAQVAQVNSPWFRHFLTYDPRPTLERVRVPVLVLNGELDLQVPPSQNLPPIEAALGRAGNRNVTVRSLPGLNHLFQTARTGAPAEYNTIDETFSPTALEIISGWIRERFGR